MMARTLILRRNALIKRLRKIGLFISGSIVEIEHTCGNPNCKCAKGKKHWGYYLTWKEDKKTHTLYIPVDLVEDVKKWNEECRLIKGIIQEVSELQRDGIRRYVVEKRRRKNVQDISKDDKSFLSGFKQLV